MNSKPPSTSLAPSKLPQFALLAGIFSALLAPVALQVRDRYSKPAASTSDSIEGTGSRVDWSAGLSEIKAEIERHTHDASLEEARIWEQFAVDWQECQTKAIHQIERELGVAVSHVVKTGEIAGLILDFARDKVSGGDRAWTRLQRHSGGFIRAMKNLSAQEQNAAVAAAEALNATNHRYATLLGGVVETRRHEVPQTTLAALDRVSRQLPLQCTIEVSATTVAAALEMAFIQSTTASLRNLLAWLSDLLAPQIAKAVTGAALVELPGVDLISVGLAVWTVADVVRLPGKIRNEVEERYRQCMNDHVKTVEADLAAKVGQISKCSIAARESLRSQLLASLQKH